MGRKRGRCPGNRGSGHVGARGGTRGRIAPFYAEDAFEAQFPIQSGRVQEGFGVVGRMALALEPFRAILRLFGCGSRFVQVGPRLPPALPCPRFPAPRPVADAMVRDHRQHRVDQRRAGLRPRRLSGGCAGSGRGSPSRGRSSGPGMSPTWSSRRPAANSTRAGRRDTARWPRPSAAWSVPAAPWNA